MTLTLGQFVEKARRGYVANAAEKAAQAVYNLRDCIPAGDKKLWALLDRQARKLSQYGASVRALPKKRKVKR